MGVPSYREAVRQADRSPAVLSKQATLLDFLWVIEDDRNRTALFGTFEGTQFWRMRAEDWRDMGEPRTITVTIEPGDRLNG